MLRSLSCAVACALLLAACGSSSTPSAPTGATPAPTPTPTATTAALSGKVTATPGGDAVAGATVKVLDGTAAGTTATTDASGNYKFTSLPVANANLVATAADLQDDSRGVFVNGTNTLNFTLTRPVWIRSGQGPDIWDMPFWVKRVRIEATYSGDCQNFVVTISGKIILTTTLGTCSIASGTSYSANFDVTPGMIEIQQASLVSYTFTELR